MKRTLILALILPLVAYLPFAWGNALPSWANITLFVGGMAAALFAVAFWVFRGPTVRLASKIMKALGALLYVIIAVGLVDVALLSAGAESVVIAGGEGWGDLAAFISWAVFIIPIAYIVGTSLLLVARHIDRPAAE